MALRHIRLGGITVLVSSLLLVLGLACGAAEESAARNTPIPAAQAQAGQAGTSTQPKSPTAPEIAATSVSAQPQPVATQIPQPTPRTFSIPTAAPRPTIISDVRYIPWAMPTDRDVLKNSGSYQSDFRLVFDMLLALQPNGDVEPWVAESWELVEPNQWRFKIRDDMTFSNGAPLTVDDVAFSANHAKEEALAAFTSGFPTFDRAVVVDAQTVDFYTSRQDVLFLRKMDFLRIVPKDYYLAAGGTDGFASAPIGSGPYVYTDWITGILFKVEARPEQHPFRDRFFSTITAETLTDPATITAAMRSGVVDIAQAQLEPEILEEMSNVGLGIVAEPARQFMYFFNAKEACEKEWPTCDAKVRRALLLATDAETYSNTIYRGFATAQRSPGLPGGPGYRDDLPVPFDQEEAKRLLDEAGFPEGPDGVRFTLRQWAWARGAANTQSLAMQADLAKVGVKTEYQLMDFGLFVAFLQQRDGRELAELMQLIGSDKTSDNFAYIRTWVTPDGLNAYDNETVWDLHDQFNEEPDPAKRDQIMGDIFEIFTQDPPYLFVNAVPEIWIIQPDIEGFEVAGGRIHFMWDTLRRVK